MELSLSPEQLILLSQFGVSFSLLVFVCFVSQSKSSPYLLPLFCVVWLALSMPAEADTQPVPTIEKDGLVLPDWSKITFDSLPAMSEAGSVSVPPDVDSALGFDPSASWQAGAKVTDVVKVGSIQELGVASMSLSDIDKLTGQSSGSLPLKSFDIAQKQSIGSMTEAVPGLGDLTALQSQPIADLIQKNASVLQDLTGGQFGLNSIKGLDLLNTPLKEVIQQLPQVGELNLKDLDLSKYPISSIPGLQNAQLGGFKDWENTFLKGVPGLGKVSIGQFANAPKEGVRALIARVDVPLDQEDQQRTRTVSGSFKAGFSVPCTSNCAHAEVSPLAGSQSQDAVNGMQWISGKVQQVEGGNGVLGKVNGGKEPTGRNPYGGMFKQVVTKIDQKKGVVETSLYMRYCHRNLGCTPYFVGPVPFLHYAEKQLIYLGEDKKDDGKGIELAQADPVGDGSGDTFDLDPCASPVGAITGPLVDKLAASSTNPAMAKKYFPLILGALKGEGITDPAQLAYALATMEHETDHFNTMHEYAGTNNDYEGGTQYYGHGFIQLTHKANYIKMSKVVGQDLVSNPELAARPDLAAKIAAYGLKNGTYTGHKLSDYFGGGKADVDGARDIVNPGDYKSMPLIKGYFLKYYSALKDGNLASAPTVGDNKDKPNDVCGGSDDKWYNPLPTAVAETAPFGQYPHGSHPHVHAGSDIAGPSGAKVHAARSGVVVDAETRCTIGDYGCGGGYGNLVVLRHKNGTMTLYGHNSRPLVKIGDQVKGGQPIAIQGTTGGSSGDHSHFEVRRGSSTNINSLPPLAPGKIGVPGRFSNACSGNYNVGAYCG